MSFTDYLSKKDVVAESVEQIDERTQEERDAEFKAFKEFYPFSKDLTRQSQAVQEWVSEMEDEAKA